MGFSASSAGRLAMTIMASAYPIGAVSDDLFAGQNQIMSTEPLVGEAFIGAPIIANQLRPKGQFSPAVITYHRDARNTRSEDYPGPLGNNLTLASSSAVQASPLMWSEDGRLTAGAICNGTTACVAALDPETFEMLASWTGPGNETGALLFEFMTYMTILNDMVLFPGLGARLFELQRIDTTSQTSFQLVRDVDLTQELGNSTQVLNTIYDADGNLWFTTGGFVGAGLSSGSAATVGYIDKDGIIYSQSFPNATIENGVAISGSVVYVVTGPAGANDHGNAVGHIYAIEAGPEGVNIIFEEEYDAGDGIKPGGVSRGSGSSPGLLGDEYVVITDNANEKINLVVWRQPNSTAGSENTGSNLVCKVPLFEANTSANECVIGSHFDGQTYSVLVPNSYNWPRAQLLNPSLDYNSTTVSDMTEVAPGLVRIDINSNGDCAVRWNLDTRTTSIPALSTTSGLFYNYYQDYDLATKNGSWVWYLSANDYESGKEAYRVRVGAGGIYNNHFQVPTIAPDGVVYMFTLGGMVKVYDGVAH